MKTILIIFNKNMRPLFKIDLIVWKRFDGDDKKHDDIVV